MPARMAGSVEMSRWRGTFQAPVPSFVTGSSAEVTMEGAFQKSTLGSMFVSVGSSVQWRFPISFQAFFAVCLVVQMISLPDTPRWLVEQDRSDEAASILARLQFEPANESTPEVVRLRRQIETAIEIESAGGPFQYKELLQGGKVQNLRRMILAAAVNIQQQFTGSNFMFVILSLCH